MKVTTTETYVFDGVVYPPGEHEASDEMVRALRRVGALPPADDADTTPSSPAGLPAGAVAGFFVPSGPGTGFDPTAVRLGAGTVPTPTEGVTPGDPVQRSALAVGPAIAASATERPTADPAANLPPPVVHTPEGETVAPVTDTEPDATLASDTPDDSGTADASADMAPPDTGDAGDTGANDADAAPTMTADTGATGAETAPTAPGEAGPTDAAPNAAPRRAVSRPRTTPE